LEWNNAVAEYVQQCYDILKRYGDDGSTLPTKIKAFQKILAGYELEKIDAAFWKYLKTKSDFPSPADIVKILENKKEIIMDSKYYAKILKENYPTFEQKEYKQAYERKLRGETND
jgi:hypothetical protein